MRCGICGKTTMRGNITGEQVPISGVYFLNRHKRTEHQAEYWAAIEARRAKAETTKQAKAAEAQRVSDARLQASKPVVVRYLGVEELMTFPSSKVARYQVGASLNGPKTGVRFPDAEAYRLYECIMVAIAGLEAEARVHLTAAWVMGTPVTLEHLDELDRVAIT